MVGGFVAHKTAIVIVLCSVLLNGQTTSTSSDDTNEGEMIQFDSDQEEGSNLSNWNDTSTLKASEHLQQSSKYKDCSKEDLSRPIYPCSKEEDPFAEANSVIDDLRYGGEEGFPYSDAYENRRVADQKGASTKTVLTHSKAAASLVTSYTEVFDAHELGESAKKVFEKMNSGKLKTILTEGLKFFSAISSVAQFVGPIFDIVMMFLPAAKSPELKAIETGFSETDAALDVLSLRLDQLEDKSDFNAILSDLVNFEASVNHGMTKYRAVATYFNENSFDEELTSDGKNLLEDLINYIRDTGNIGKQLQFHTQHILEGSKLAFDGERLLTTFRRAQKNDCSKILPFGYSLLNIVRKAQKLQFIYELNQGMIDSSDDKGYPKDVHDIYHEVVGQYADCNRNVANYALDVSK